MKLLESSNSGSKLVKECPFLSPIQAVVAGCLAWRELREPRLADVEALRWRAVVLMLDCTVAALHGVGSGCLESFCQCWGLAGAVEVEELQLGQWPSMEEFVAELGGGVEGINGTRRWR
ncbi:hypothetical protein KSP39_PZI000723 [Platanthera zijinensis]|uniref:Uncharacterized protein n=1 Tax=Platanthera zijinensis TaxID=2320716 RepID=A0AAP0C679_9ASPA